MLRIRYWLVTAAALMLSTHLWANFYTSAVSETTYDDAPALVVRFTEALPLNTQLQNFVTVTPAPENGSIWVSIDEGSSWVLPFVEPATRYQLLFNNIPPASSGNPYEIISISRSSGDLPSNQWQIETRPMPPSLSFTDTGVFLAGSKNTALPITTVNVPEVELELFRVRDNLSYRFLTDTYFQGMESFHELDNISRWADLVHSARYSIDLIDNQRTTKNLDIKAALSQFNSGVYIAVLREPGRYRYQYDTRVFTQSSVGVHARFYNDIKQVYVHDSLTGEAIDNANVTFFYRASGQTSDRMEQRQSNAQGLVSISGTMNPQLITVEHNGQFSFVRTARDQLDLSAYTNVTQRHNQRQLFMFGPRDLYRPGESIHINAIQRDFDGQKVFNSAINASLVNSRGQTVSNFSWLADESGLYQFEFELDQTAPTGDWWLQAELNNEMRVYRFKVEEFLPERLSLAFFDGQRSDYRYVDNLSEGVPVQADYLYGAPAANNEVDAVVTISPATNLFERWSDFRFNDPTATIDVNTQQIERITLDENGQGSLPLPALHNITQMPLNYRVTASVYETGGRPVTRSQSVIYLPSSQTQWVGVDAHFEGLAVSNDLATFTVINANQEGHLTASRVEVALIRKNRNYYWSWESGSGWRWRFDAENYIAHSQTIDVGATPIDIQVPLQWGDYELHLTNSEGTKTVFPFRTQYYWSNPLASSMRPDVIDVVLPNGPFVPGETLVAEFTAAASGTALIQVENNQGPLYQETISVKAGSQTLNIPTQPNWTRHDSYLSIMLLAPSDQINEVAPKRSIGLIHLPQKRVDRELQVSINAPTRIEPNTTVTASLAVDTKTVREGEKVWATMALVDQGVLNITRFQRPQPERALFQPKRFENTYLDMYGKIINNLPYNNIQQRWGGGFAESDDALSRGGDQPQSDVQIVSFFSKPVEVINGEAEFSFELPNFNGRLKWMTVVWSDNRFGSAETSTTVADLLVTQIAMPRFIAQGDQSQIALDLHNLSGFDDTFDVTVSISGSVASTFKEQQIRLQDKEKTTIIIPIAATKHQGQGVISVSATNGNTINVQQTRRLGVRSAYPLATYQIRQTIAPNTAWQPTPDASHLRSESLQAQLTLSPLPAINFTGHFDYLLQYPYGCLEQTISSTLPWLLIDANAFELFKLNTSFQQRFAQSYTDEFRRQQLESGIKRILSKQKTDGRFGYWDSQSMTSMWGSAYATELLIEATQLGIAIDEIKLQAAIGALQSMVKGTQTEAIWRDNASAYELSYRAYAAMVLAKANSASLSDVRRLYQQFESANMRATGLPWIHLSVALQLTGDTMLANQAAEKAQNIERNDNHYYADYGSSVRDLSAILTLSMEHGLPYRAELLDQLSDQLVRRTWLSTQERIALMRLGKLFSQSGQQWQASVLTTSFNQNLDQEQPFNSLLHGEQLNSIESIRAADKTLYATLAWQGIPKSAPEASENGLRLSRQFYHLDGSEVDFNQPIDSGTVVIARLRTQALEHRFPEALLVNLLPAGFELENPNLTDASLNLADITIGDQNLAEHFNANRVQYQEYRDDRYIASIDVSSYRSTTLFVLMRAVTPGTYKVPNALIEDMYRPEFRAVSATPETITVR